MYKIEKKDYGVKLTFGGFIQQDEMAQWVAESEKFLLSAPSKFGVFVDMRELKPLSKDAQIEMEKGQIAYKSKGMERSVVILDNPITTMQFKRIAKETGIHEWERYIDTSVNPGWEKAGIDWIVHAINPEK
jgi:hypothetical protein